MPCVVHKVAVVAVSHGLHLLVVAVCRSQANLVREIVCVRERGYQWCIGSLEIKGAQANSLCLVRKKVWVFGTVAYFVVI